MSEVKPKSPYSILNSWLLDGSLTTSLPQELLDDKVIPQHYLLYYFQSSKYIIYLNEHFNTFDLYTSNKTDVFYFMKECVYRSGYKPPFIKRKPTEKIQLLKFFKNKFPYLKDDEIAFLCSKIEDKEYADTIYEMAGLKNVIKKRITKKEQKELSKVSSKKQVENIKAKDIIKNFSI